MNLSYRITDSFFFSNYLSTKLFTISDNVMNRQFFVTDLYIKRSFLQVQQFSVFPPDGFPCRPDFQVYTLLYLLRISVLLPTPTVFFQSRCGLLLLFRSLTPPPFRRSLNPLLGVLDVFFCTISVVFNSLYSVQITGNLKRCISTKFISPKVTHHFLSSPYVSTFSSVPPLPASGARTRQQSSILDVCSFTPPPGSLLSCSPLKTN